MLNERLATFMRYETTVVGKVQYQMASAMPTRFVSVLDEEAKPRPVKLNVKTYFNNEGGVLFSGSVKYK